MKEFRGTPGVFLLKEWRESDQDGSYLNGGLHIVSESGHMISSTTIDGDTEEEEANVRLMAASKDLLEALQGMLAQFTKTPSSLKDTEARIKAHAAIAKALGE